MDNCQNLVNVTDADFAATVLNSTVPVIVDFWASWCRPCHMIAPDLEQVAQEFCERLLVAKMDVDTNIQVPLQYGVMGMPTLIFFKGGKEIARIAGVSRDYKQVLRARLNAALE